MAGSPKAQIAIYTALLVAVLTLKINGFDVSVPSSSDVASAPAAALPHVSAAGEDDGVGATDTRASFSETSDALLTCDDIRDGKASTTPTPTSGTAEGKVWVDSELWNRVDPALRAEAIETAAACFRPGNRDDR